ncbi:MAG: sulfite exporter TauE/SafE family protein [Bacteroidia bacterium]
MELIIAAISLGLLGSFHCIGMCGPIALALPVHQYSPTKKYMGIALYNLGRVITYTFLGLIFGLLGQSFFLGGVQQVVSILLGVALLASVIATNTRFFSAVHLSFIYIFVSTVKQQLGKLFNKKGIHFLFFIGLLNGLLPCGLVYLGIAGAIATGHYSAGAAFMFYFGIGTVPTMYAVAFFGQFITLKYRNYIQRAMPVVVVFMAVMLIVRGLNLGIPYMSPRIEKNNVVCCHKTHTEPRHMENTCHKTK